MSLAIARAATYVARVAALATLASGALTQAAHAGSAYEGAWLVHYVSSKSFDLELRYRSDGHSSDIGETLAYDARTFPDLTPSEIQSAQGDKSFRIVRDAGTFECHGYFADGSGSGLYEFTPTEGYASALEARGLGRPTGDEQFTLAFEDIRLDEIDRLRSAGIEGLSASALVKLADHGVGPRYVNDILGQGVHPASVDELMRLRDHGVDGAFVAGLTRYGYHPTVSDLVRLRDHGVDLDFVARLRAHGYNPSVEDLIRLRDAGM